MPQSDPSPLGIASIDRLRALSEASERQRATEGRQILDLPIEEVQPDPDQVRRDFAGDVTLPSDTEELSGLALSIKALGVRSPIRVRRTEAGGYVIVFGERRWRASVLAGKTTIPCIVEPQAEFDPKRHTLEQLVENIQRQDLRLLDVVHAVARCAEESGLNASQLAKELGKSRPWISKHLALSRAKGLPAEALAEGYLTNLESARRYCRLAPVEQERLLRRARATGSPISKAEVERLDRRQSALEEAARAAPALDLGCGPSEKGSGDEPLHRFALTTDQLLELIRRLGGDPIGEPSVALVLELLEESVAAPPS